MPAIKFQTKHSVDMVTDRDHRASNTVYLYTKRGRLEPVVWLEFCRKEEISKTEFPDCAGRFVKMNALSVSRHSGSMAERWRILHPGEYVLAYLVMYNTYEHGVYTIIDDRGWPVVMGGGASERLKYASC